MVDSLYHIISLLFFDISLLYYYINLKSSSFDLRSLIIFCLNSEGINLSVSISYLFFSELFFGEVFETLVILSAVFYQ